MGKRIKKVAASVPMEIERTSPLFATETAGAATTSDGPELSPKSKATEEPVGSRGETIDPKLPSRSSESASTSHKTKGGKADEEGNSKSLEEAGASANGPTVDAGTSASLSKISSTFTSLMKRMQQSDPVTEIGIATSDGGAATKNSVITKRIEECADAKRSKK